MSTHSSTLSRPETMNVAVKSKRHRTNSSSTSESAQLGQLKCPYNVDQQVKYLHLQAEIETLLLQLQTLKQNNATTLILEESNLNSSKDCT